MDVLLMLPPVTVGLEIVEPGSVKPLGKVVAQVGTTLPTPEVIKTEFAIGGNCV